MCYFWFFEYQRHMAQQKVRTLSEIGEFGLIRKVTGDIILRHSSSRKGVGDDAAVIDHQGYLTLVTTDLLLEGIHFDLDYVPLKHLGYKSVVVNVSDIYAMNGTPLQVTVSLGISSKFSLGAIEELYRGIKLACKQYEVDLVGGDTSASQTGLVISVTALGIAQSQQVVYRQGAKKGDLIGVSGDLGGAYMGLMLLEQEHKIFMQDRSYKPQLEGYQYILERQLKPEARKDLIKLFYEKKIKPTAMLDVSDGLSSDLIHLCESSGVGSRVIASRLPIHAETAKFASRLCISPMAAALNGGEDYELLFTLSPKDYEVIQSVEGVTIIGVITDQADGYQLELEDKSTLMMEPGGWNANQKWE